MSLRKRSIRAFLKTINSSDRLDDGSDVLQPSVLSLRWSKFAEKPHSGEKQGNHRLLWYYCASNVGLFIGFGPVVYCEDKVGRCWSYWFVVISPLFAILILRAVTPKYGSAEALVIDLGRRLCSLALFPYWQYESHQRRKLFRSQKRKTGILNSHFLWGSFTASEMWNSQIAASLCERFRSFRPFHLIIISQLLSRTFSKVGLCTVVNAIWTGTTVLVAVPAIFNSFVVPFTRKFRGRRDRVSIPRRIAIAVVVVILSVVTAATVQKWRLQRMKAARRRMHLGIGYCVAQEVLMAFAEVFLGQPVGEPFLRGCVQKLLNPAGSLSWMDPA
ncbi:hypothetical protein R1sor_024754 [Riccia sorocarpa]|uniref:Uncharacterized protein n=1 Tax=Riccia sorocarpa TaxID=122646 RepID=A0ABD3GRE0_9MARC